jgi:hypothetical protein
MADSLENLAPTQSEIRKIPTLGLDMGYGQLSKEVAKLIPIFQGIRLNGEYAADRNRDTPFFSENIVLHGLSDIHSRDLKSFSPPSLETVRSICTTGIIADEVLIDGAEPKEKFEEETPCMADFFAQVKPASSVVDFIEHLNNTIAMSKGYVTSFETRDWPSTSSLMFAFNISKPGLAPLMQYALYGNQTPETMWTSRYEEKDYNYINFPGKSAAHLAVPVGLPANYIEYIVVNDKSPHWQGDKIKELQAACVCDDHPIPLISLHTGEVIK